MKEKSHVSITRATHVRLIMTWRWRINTGEGRLLVRASATILYVHKGVSLTKWLDEFAHEIAADVNAA